MHKKLEAASYISLIAAALVFIGATFAGHLRNSLPSSPNQAAEQHISFNSLSSDKQMLVLAMSSRCHFCVASTPFYQALSQARGSGKASTKLVVVSPEPLITTETFLRAKGIVADLVVSRPLEDLDVQGTPTLLLVGHGGTVEKRWEGQLNATGQQQVLSAIASGNGGIE